MNVDVLAAAFRPFQIPLPSSAAGWEAEKPCLRRRLEDLFGPLPTRQSPEISITARELRPGYEFQRLTFDNGAGDTVHGVMLIPEGRKAPGPAILYHHYHGEKYGQGTDELLTNAFAEMGHPTLVTGEELVRAGYLVLAIDAYGFGRRQYCGPAGELDRGNQTEHSLFKMFLWQGLSFWGMIVRDDRLALDVLLSRPEVDPARVAVMGMSMGSTRSWWLAALDERVKAVVSVSCLTRYQDLIASGGLRYHGIYYYVPGMLAAGIDTEAVIGLIAPRPHLTLTGDNDPGSPASGVRTINAFQEGLYRLYGREENFRGVIYPGVGHEYTPGMWQETVDWLSQKVGRPSQAAMG